MYKRQAIDGLRADHVQALGYDRPTTPTLDGLAREGVLFREAFTSAPQVLPAHVALMTGCEPTVARRFLPNEFEGLSERRWRIPARVPQLAVELLAAGYATAAFLDDPLLSEVHGFGPGFQRFEVLDEETAQSWEGPQPTRVVDHLQKWLRSLPAGRPWFAYVHFAELERFWSRPQRENENYFAPRPELSDVPPVGSTDSVLFAVPRSHWRGGSRTLGQYEAAYDGEIHGLDVELERLFASLRRLGRFDSTSIHVVGSYGMQFGEAGLYLSAGRYSMADLRVPWIVRPRASLGLPTGRSIVGPVSLIDLAPTILELEGLPVPVGMHGLSLAGALRAPEGKLPERPFVFASCGIQEGCALISQHLCLEYLVPAGTADAQLRRSWFGEWVDLVVAPTLRFYDWRRTPYPPLSSGQGSEGENLAPLRAAAVDWLRDLNDARVFLQAPPGRSGLPPEAIQRLREKGYVGR